MKPILYPANETAFTSNGLGRISPTKCVIREEKNGAYELECVVPADSDHYPDISNNMILYALTGGGVSHQAFRIYNITEPMNGLVTIRARHITYDLSYNTVMPFTAGSCTAALAGLETYAVESCPFTFWTDKSTAASFSVLTPATIRSRLGGVQGSILDAYGGEYEWDNWTVKLHNSRGQDRDVVLRYGKNITDINQENNLETVVTGIVPFWADTEGNIVTLPEKSVDSSYASSYPFKRTVPVDFSSDYQNAPTQAQLRAKAQSYITANKVGIPKINIKVSFVALWQTEEYKDIAPLERVYLCDTVHVVFEKYNINASAKVIAYEWDVLRERYNNIELGEARSKLSSTIAEIGDIARQGTTEVKSEMQKAIDNATKLITGNKGGYVILKPDANGEPEEILVMNTKDITTATKLWRWNLSGLGYSGTGYSGPYGTAITMDGAIVADYITAGEMSAARIKAGILTDLAGKFSLDMTTGALSMSDGTFSGTIQGSSISGSTITSSKTSGGVTKTTKIEDGTITTNDLQATAGTFKGTVSAGTVSGGTVSGAAISGGTISGTSITGSSLKTTSNGGYAVNISGSKVQALHNDTELGYISGGIYDNKTWMNFVAGNNAIGINNADGIYTHGALDINASSLIMRDGNDSGTGNTETIRVKVYDSFADDYIPKDIKMINGVITSIV